LLSGNSRGKIRQNNKNSNAYIAVGTRPETRMSFLVARPQYAAAAALLLLRPRVAAASVAVAAAAAV